MAKKVYILVGLTGIAVVGVVLFTTRYLTDRKDILLTKRSVVVSVLSTVEVVSPTIHTAHNTVQYYEKNAGRVSEVQFDGSGLRQISTTKLPDFISSEWSRDSQAVISSFSSPDGLQLRLYRFGETGTVALPNGARSAVFSPDSSRIAYLTVDSSGATVFLKGTGGTAAKKIFSTRMSDGTLLWPNDLFVALTLWQTSTRTADIFLIDTDGKITRLLENQQDVEQTWSPSGKRVLISLKNQRGTQELWVRDLETTTFSILPVVTSAQRCAWTHDEKSVLCAVATKNTATAPDRFDRVDLTTGVVQNVATSDEITPRLIAEQVLLSPNEDYLVVTNRRDGKLYSITLPKE